MYHRKTEQQIGGGSLVEGTHSYVPSNKHHTSNIITGTPTQQQKSALFYIFYKTLTACFSLNKRKPVADKLVSPAQ